MSSNAACLAVSADTATAASGNAPNSFVAASTSEAIAASSFSVPAVVFFDSPAAFSTSDSTVSNKSSCIAFCEDTSTAAGNPTSSIAAIGISERFEAGTFSEPVASP